MVPTIENAAKHLGVKRLHATAQNGGVIGHRFHRNHFCPHRFNRGLGPSGGINRDAKALELCHDGLEAILVEHGNEGGFDVAEVGHDVEGGGFESRKTTMRHTISKP